MEEPGMSGQNRDEKRQAAKVCAEALREIADGLEAGKYRLDSFRQAAPAGRLHPKIGDVAARYAPTGLRTAIVHYMDLEQVADYLELSPDREVRKSPYDGLLPGGWTADDELDSRGSWWSIRDGEGERVCSLTQPWGTEAQRKGQLNAQPGLIWQMFQLGQRRGW